MSNQDAIRDAIDHYTGRRRIQISADDIDDMAAEVAEVAGCASASAPDGRAARIEGAAWAVLNSGHDWSRLRTLREALESDG